MPSGDVHKSAGAILGVITYLVVQNNSRQKGKIELGEIILSTLVGIRTARIPDILEPPIHPNHRDFFHSLTFGVMIGYVGFTVFEDLKIIRHKRTTLGVQQWSTREYVEIAIIIACGAIILHLIMDGFTVKGLNII
jgi:RsiW-degrading membrane proteinase PrsW (M82 family)